MSVHPIFEPIVNPPFIDETGACSDFSSKLKLLEAVLDDEVFSSLVSLNRHALDSEQSTPGAIEQFDSRLMRWLSSLPSLVRLVVELRSGLWTGAVLPRDHASIADELGLTERGVQGLYEEGLRLLGRKEAVEGLEPRLDPA